MKTILILVIINLIIADDQSQKCKKSDWT
jgi:hypothetical protein